MKEGQGSGERNQRDASKKRGQEEGQDNTIVGKV